MQKLSLPVSNLMAMSVTNFPGPPLRTAPANGLTLTVNITAARGNNFASPSGGYDRFANKMEKMVKDLIRHITESEAALGDYNY